MGGKGGGGDRTNHWYPDIHLRSAVLQRDGGWTCSIHDRGSTHSKLEKYLQWITNHRTKWPLCSCYTVSWLSPLGNRDISFSFRCTRHIRSTDCWITRTWGLRTRSPALQPLSHQATPGYSQWVTIQRPQLITSFTANNLIHS